MPVPKRRSSRSRGRKRRTHWKIKESNLIECPHCHSLMKPHRVCPHCGYYKGRLVKKDLQEA
ncbi:50S ribosomal protein L32 [candidate division WOR-3 bacterium]|nr:50S ribosomal protein L32 [candidate division WOR-3 bacterium]